MSNEKDLEARLLQIHKRLQWIADTEARAAWVAGYGARGEFEDERDQLLKQAEEILTKLEDPRTTM
jgi:predicted nucleotide-binding protein (sugar kinase/HSP70/actin superfamily)